MEALFVAFADSIQSINFTIVAFCIITPLALYALFAFRGTYKRFFSKSSTNAHLDHFAALKSNSEHFAELESIKQKMSTSSSEPIKIDAVKALYIAQHWDEYNLIGSEDGKVVFQKLKDFSDVVESHEPHDALAQNVLTQNQDDEKKEIIMLPNGTMRLMQKLGYIDFDAEGKIIGSKNFEEASSSSKETPKKKMSAEEKKEQVALAEKALSEDEPISPATKKQPIQVPQNDITKIEAPIVPENNLVTQTKEQAPSSLDAYLQQCSKAKQERTEVAIQEPSTPTTQVSKIQTIAQTIHEEAPSPSDVILETLPSPLETKKVETDNAPLKEPAPLQTAHTKSQEHIKGPSKKEEPWTQQLVAEAETVIKENLYTSDAPLLDPKNLAASLVKKDPPPQKTKLIPEYSYAFDDMKSFFNSTFLSQEAEYSDKLSSFLHFVSQHPYVFLSDNNQRMFIHVDSLVLSLARSIIDEHRFYFFEALYDDEAISFKKCSEALALFSAKIHMKYDETFFQAWTPTMMDYRSFVFQAALKKDNKLFKGDFIILNFKNKFKKLLSEEIMQTIQIATTLSTSSSEIETLSGKSIKLKTRQEILNVL